MSVGLDTSLFTLNKILKRETYDIQAKKSKGTSGQWQYAQTHTG